MFSKLELKYFELGIRLGAVRCFPFDWDANKKFLSPTKSKFRMYVPPFIYLVSSMLLVNGFSQYHSLMDIASLKFSVHTIMATTQVFMTGFFFTAGTSFLNHYAALTNYLYFEALEGNNRLGSVC